jgi:hypothetical protein
MPASPLRASGDDVLLGRDFSYQIRFLADPPARAVTTFGHVDLAGWTRLHEELLAEPRIRGLPLLLDHSQLDATFLQNADGRTMAEIAQDTDEELRPSRRAIVLVEGFEFGLMQTCRAHLDADTASKVRAFRSRGAALAWLRMPTPASEVELTPVVASSGRDA